MQQLYARASKLLESSTFFWVLMGILAFEALWITLTFNYPMLWDEYYHFGLIEFYSHHISPIIQSQPTSLDLYGNVERSPKYFYHYLLSFPLRIVEPFITSETGQVIFLRILNIGMFIGALVAYRHALLRTIRSQKIVNFTMLVIVLLPMSSLLAAHVNYDNLQFLLSGLIFYLAVRFIQSKYKESASLIAIVGIAGIGSVVKYTFLPVFVGILAYLLFRMWRQYGIKKSSGQLVKNFLGYTRWAQTGLIVLVLLGGVLFVERFGVNLAVYHAIEPKCDKVLTVERCLSFSPYKQEHTLAKQTSDSNATVFTPITFTVKHWFRDIYRQFFRSGTQIQYEWFESPEPYRIPFYTMLAALIIALVASIMRFKQIFWRHEYQMFLVASFVLAASLWIVDLEKYIRTGAPLAIQGRYLIPVVPILIAIGLVAAANVIPKLNHRRILATIVVVALIWGGGILPHIVKGRDAWYWNNEIVLQTTETIRKILSPILF